MAAGYELSDGKYYSEMVSEDELWSALTCVFSSKSKNTSSYKYGFLKAIIDNLYNTDENLVLSFDQLFNSFAEIYWNLILKYRLRQTTRTQDGRISYLEQILYHTVEKHSIPTGVPFENLSTEIMMEITHQVKVKCKKYVVGAVFEDTKKLFYSFSKKGEWIRINPQMFEFICKHKTIIEKANYYEWARFLEKVNSGNEAICLLTKIEESSKRTDLSIYRHILFDEFENNTCFYCGKKVIPRTIDMDHFIPWSFIKADNLWNLVVSCSNCNRRKSDRLAGKTHLLRLIERNRMIVSSGNNLLGENYRESELNDIYRWAILNGYDATWEPK